MRVIFCRIADFMRVMWKFPSKDEPYSEQALVMLAALVLGAGFLGRLAVPRLTGTEPPDIGLACILLLFLLLLPPVNCWRAWKQLRLEGELLAILRDSGQTEIDSTARRLRSYRKTDIRKTLTHMVRTGRVEKDGRVFRIVSAVDRASEASVRGRDTRGPRP